MGAIDSLDLFAHRFGVSKSSTVQHCSGCVLPCEILSLADEFFVSDLSDACSVQYSFWLGRQLFSSVQLLALTVVGCKSGAAARLSSHRLFFGFFICALLHRSACFEPCF